MPPKSAFNPTKFIQWFSIEGFVAVIVIIVSLIIAGLSFFDVIEFDSNKLLAVNAAILSILAALSVANSIKLVSEERALIELTEQSKRKDLASLVLKQRQYRPNLEEFVHGAKRVIICDAFLSSFRIEQHLLVKLLQSDCDIFIIALDPDNNELLGEMAKFSVLEDIENLRHLLQAGINNFKLVAQLYTKQEGATESTGSIQVGYSKVFLPFSGVLVESHDQNDHVLIEMFPYKFDELKIHRYHFVLDKKNTPELFNTYKSTLDSLFVESDTEKFKSQISPQTASLPQNNLGQHLSPT